jgi:hypothetical protein
LKHDEKKLIPLVDQKVKKFRSKIGWNSQIRLPYAQMDGAMTNIEEEDNQPNRRPEVWFYKLDEDRKKDITKKVLKLILVEVTVPFGYATVNFTMTENGVINDAEKPTTNYNSLEEARKRKVDKYKEIETEARKIFENS